MIGIYKITETMTTNKNQFKELVKYLNIKGCRFMVKMDYENNTESIFGVTWYKKGKFYMVNNIVVAKNMLEIVSKFIPYGPSTVA